MPIDERELKELARYLAMESLSAEPGSPGAEEARVFLAGLMERAGLSRVRRLETPGAHAALYGERLVDPALPTILFYGHYDVQPAAEGEGWIGKPFELRAEGDWLYGRGVSDNKGQHYSALTAMREILEAGRPLRANIKALIEGNEEVGSRGMGAILEAHADLIRCDFVLGIDGEMAGLRRPTLYHATKGQLIYTLELRTNSKELHSGYYGNIAVNAGNTLAEFAAELRDKDGRIALPGIHDGLVRKAEEEANFESALALRSEQGFDGIDCLLAPKRTALERNYFEPSCDVHAISVGDAARVKSSIPNTGKMIFSLRLMPGQSAARADAAMREWAKGFFERRGIRDYTMKLEASSEPTYSDPTSETVRRISGALEKLWGERPVVSRFPASLPAVTAFESLGFPFILVGFGGPGSNAHGANERLHVDHYESVKRFIREILVAA